MSTMKTTITPIITGTWLVGGAAVMALRAENKQPIADGRWFATYLHDRYGPVLYVLSLTSSACTMYIKTLFFIRQ